MLSHLSVDWIEFGRFSAILITVTAIAVGTVSMLLRRD